MVSAPETTGQRTDAAERSAHVLRAGDAPQPAREIFTGPEFGPLRLRVVADMEAENARLREENARLRVDSLNQREIARYLQLRLDRECAAAPTPASPPTP